MIRDALYLKLQCIQPILPSFKLKAPLNTEGVIWHKMPITIIAPVYVYLRITKISPLTLK